MPAPAGATKVEFRLAPKVGDVFAYRLKRVQRGVGTDPNLKGWEKGVETPMNLDWTVEYSFTIRAADATRVEADLVYTRSAGTLNTVPFATSWDTAGSATPKAHDWTCVREMAALICLVGSPARITLSASGEILDASALVTPLRATMAKAPPLRYERSVAVEDQRDLPLVALLAPLTPAGSYVPGTARKERTVVSWGFVESRFAVHRVVEPPTPTEVTVRDTWVFEPTKPHPLFADDVVRDEGGGTAVSVWSRVDGFPIRRTVDVRRQSSSRTGRRDENTLHETLERLPTPPTVR